MTSLQASLTTHDPKLEAAFLYAGLGFRVLPVWPHVKVPRITEFPRKATTDTGKILQWYSENPEGNFSVIIPKGWACLDIDGEKGLHSAKKLLPNLFCHTALVKTSRGYHLWFRTSRTLPSKLKLSEELELLGPGWWMMMPPNRFEGHIYTWVCGSLSEAPALPPSILVKVQKAMTRKAWHELNITWDDLDQEGRTQLLEKIKAALSCIPAHDYYLWLEIGMALHCDLPEELAFELWDDWSSTSSKYEERTQHSTWRSFDHSNRNPVRLGTVFRHAREMGKGEDLERLLRLHTGSSGVLYSDPEQVFDEVRREIFNWTPGSSRHFSAFPGTRKSSYAILWAGMYIRERPGQKPVVVHSLKTKSLVTEKLRDALIKGVSAVEFRGRSQEEDGWHCTEFTSYQFGAQQGQHFCKSCPARSDCESKTGNFLHSQQTSIRRIRAGEVLVVCTEDSLPSVDKHLPQEAAIIVDDSDTRQGLVIEREISVSAIKLESEAIKFFLNKSPRSESKKLAKTCQKLLQQVIEMNEICFNRNAKSFELEVGQLDAISWNSGDLSRWILEAASKLGPSKAVFRENKVPNLITVCLPNHSLIERARKGQVQWLGVLPPPRMISESLGLEEVHVPATPIMKTIQVFHPDTTFGAGPPGNRNKLAAAATRAITKALLEKHPESGAVLHKADAENIDVDRVLWFGRHFGSNKLKDSNVLVIRRFMRPIEASEFDAKVILASLGISQQKVGRLRDELVDYEIHHNMLNAAGRLRPLSSPGKSLILLNHDPIPGVPVTMKVTVDELFRLMHLDPKYLQEIEKSDGRKARRFNSIEELREYRKQNPQAKQKDARVDLGMSTSTLKRYWKKTQPGRTDGEERKGVKTS